MIGFFAPPLALDPFAGGGGPRVDVLRDRRRTDERDRANVGMVEQRVHGLLAVDQADDPGRQLQAVQQFEDAVHGHGHALGRLEDERVAAGDRIGHEPQGIMPGEVKGVIAARSSWRALWQCGLRIADCDC